MSAVAFFVLQGTIIAAQGPDSLLKKAVGADRKGRVSTALYLAGIVLAHWRPWLADGCYVLVALLWLVPDRRIERILAAGE
jgi:hypothetical protein